MTTMTCCCCTDGGPLPLDLAPACDSDLPSAPAPGGRAFTVGHSTRPIDDFIALLSAHGISQLVDVRTVPRSRHNPQFETRALAQSLAQARIGYALAPGLGGFRRTSPESPNSAWRNLSFRGYADYMLTPDFHESLVAVIELMKTDRVALMCAEAVPWRCHRSLIADALTVAGWRVLHIQSRRTARPHRRTPFLRVRGGALRYPALPSAADA